MSNLLSLLRNVSAFVAATTTTTAPLTRVSHCLAVSGIQFLPRSPVQIRKVVLLLSRATISIAPTELQQAGQFNGTYDGLRQFGNDGLSYNWVLMLGRGCRAYFTIVNNWQIEMNKSK